MPTEDNCQRALPLLLTSPILLMNPSPSARFTSSSIKDCSNSSSSHEKLADCLQRPGDPQRRSCTHPIANGEKIMTRSSDGIELTLFSKPQLLITESAADFAALNAALMEEIKPRGTIERLYVDDIAALVWEILRLRRCKAVIVNIAFKAALSDTVYRLAGQPQVGTPQREWYEAIVFD